MYIFEEHEPAGQAVRRILVEKIDESLVWLDEYGAGPVITVHETRKNIKRCRALLRLVRFGLGDDWFRRENYAFRDVGRLFSDLRDREVLLQTYRLLHAPLEEVPESAPLEAFGFYLEAGRDRAYAESLADPERRRAVRAGLLAIRGRWDAAAPQVARADVQRGFALAWKQASRRFLSAAGEPRTAQKYHEWRKTVKHLWYQHELLSAWAGGGWEFGERTARLDHLSDLLGLAHDAAVLEAETDGHAALAEAPGFRRQVAYFRLDQEGAALLHGARLFYETPG